MARTGGRGSVRGALRAGAIGAWALLAAAAAQAEPAAAADSGWGYALADELMSPWCPGFALPDCASGYASELRLWILEQERLGRPEDEVRAEILQRYGERMLQAPRAEGRGVLAYAIPAALILGGLGVLVAFLRRQGGARVAEPAPAAAGGADDALLRRVDAELERFERDRA